MVLNKKNIGIIFLLLFSGVAMSYTIGQVITQEQFDNQDFMTADLNLSLNSVTRNIQDIRLEIGYDTLRKQVDVNGLETDNWVVVRKINNIFYPLENYVMCRRASDSTKAGCISMAKRTIKSQIKEFREQTRIWLERQKTDYASEISGNDFGSDILPT